MCIAGTAIKVPLAALAAMAMFAGCGASESDSLAPEDTVAAAEPTPSPTPTSANVSIVCYDSEYREYEFDAPEDAWPYEFDYCDSPPATGTPSAREAKALDIAYGDSGDVSSLAILYDICAQTDPKSFDYLKTAGSPSQVREIKGMLFLCPDHPLRSAIEKHLGEAEKRNKLEAQGRIFHDGTYRVGEEIQPGTYFVEDTGDGCYWERTDRTGEIIDNNFSTGLRVEVTIQPSDYSFTAEGCGKWQPVE